jgi:hypothetical protein
VVDEEALHGAPTHIRVNEVQQLLRAVIPRVAPSIVDCRVHEYSGRVTLSFRRTDDFVAAVFAAQCANVGRSVSCAGRRWGKSNRRAGIDRCALSLDFGPELRRVEAIFFLYQLLILRRRQGQLDTATYERLRHDAWRVGLTLDPECPELAPIDAQL